MREPSGLNIALSGCSRDLNAAKSTVILIDKGAPRRPELENTGHPESVNVAKCSVLSTYGSTATPSSLFFVCNTFRTESLTDPSDKLLLDNGDLYHTFFLGFQNLYEKST